MFQKEALNRIQFYFILDWADISCILNACAQNVIKQSQTRAFVNGRLPSGVKEAVNVLLASRAVGISSESSG